jgi:hypothetical protein
MKCPRCQQENPHRRHLGDLDAGVEGEVVWIGCHCGGSMARRIDEDDRAGRA